MAIPLLVLAAFITINVTFPYPRPLQVGIEKGSTNVRNFPSPPEMNAPPCSLNHISFIQDAIQAENPPQLSFEQILWIYTIVQTSASAVASMSPATHNFLVWGLGYDSPIWDNANCIPSTQAADGGGLSQSVVRANGATRTVFVENWLDWVEKVKGKYPMLNVLHFDKYETNVATAAEFFTRPYLLPLPGEVDDVCWNAVLVGG